LGPFAPGIKLCEERFLGGGGLSVRKERKMGKDQRPPTGEKKTLLRRGNYTPQEGNQGGRSNPKCRGFHEGGVLGGKLRAREKPCWLVSESIAMRVFGAETTVIGGFDGGGGGFSQGMTEFGRGSLGHEGRGALL